MTSRLIAPAPRAKASPPARRLLKLTALATLAALLWLAAAQLYHATRPSFGPATLILPGHAPKAFAYPFQWSDPPPTAFLLVQQLQLPRHHPTTFVFYPQDFLWALSVNGHDIHAPGLPLTGSSHEGRSINLAPWLHPGLNTLALQMEVHSHAASFRLDVSPWDSYRLVLLAIAACATVATTLLFYTLSGARFLQPEPIILMAGIGLRYIYVSGTPYFVRSFDCAGHAAYLDYVTQHLRLPPPDANWEAFHQPANQSINYLNLLNGHFTWMAEGGWAFSLFYMAGWFAVILLCWPEREGLMRGVPLAVWTAFGIGAFFSQVEDSIWLWLLPFLFLVFAVGARMRRKRWPAWRSIGWIGFASTSAVIVVIGFGHATADLPIKAGSQAVVIGHGGNKSLIYIDRGVMGKLYGHTLRKYWRESGDNLSGQAYVITETAKFPAPTDVSQIIVCGKMAQGVQIPAGLQGSGQFILINPECFPEEMKWGASMKTKARVYFGEYAEGRSRSSWETCAGVRYLVIDGAGDFVPAWPRAIWKPAGT